jgi:hypothetical protein
MQKITELYLAFLTTGRRVVFSIEDDYNVNEGISQKKKRIIRTLNEKLGSDLVVSIVFYGYADVDVKDKFIKKKKYEASQV